MGDRALVVFHDKDKQQFSPATYLQCSGSRVRGLLEEVCRVMDGRDGDVDYAAARFVGVCHNAIDGNLSLGIFNSPHKTKPGFVVKTRKASGFRFGFDTYTEAEKWLQDRHGVGWPAYFTVEEDPVFDHQAVFDELTSREFSHGDAGVFLADCQSWRAVAYNGYGFRGAIVCELLPARRQQ